MRLIAVCNIIDKDNNTIGLRLLDVDTKTIKDVPVDDVVDVLNKGIATIENIGTNGNELIGTNGSINRLTKVNCMRVIGESRVVIVNQISGDKYLVSDYKGILKTLTKNELIAYAKDKGIANGKIVSKEDKEFISAIRGTFGLLDNKSRDKSYTGILLNEYDKLHPINHEGLVVRLKDCKLVCEDTNNNLVIPSENKIEESIVFRNGVRECCGYTIADSHILMNIETIDINNRKIPELPYIISTVNFRDEMLEVIRNTNLDNDISITDNIKYGKGIRYNDIEFYIDVDKSSNKILPISYEEYTKIVDNLIRMETKIEVAITVKTDNMALFRKCSSKGIEYKIFDGLTEDGCMTISESAYGLIKDRIKTVRLEDIYRDKEKYNNVWEEDGLFYIRGLDGVYSYDMDKIAEQYGRMESKKNKNNVYKLFGRDIRESITDSGELSLLDVGENEIVIRNGTKIIKDKSVIVKTNHERITIERSVEKCSSNFIQLDVFPYMYRGRLKEIVMLCNESAYPNILKGFIKNQEILNSDVAFRIARDITPKEYGLAMCISNLKPENIYFNNRDKVDINFIKQAIDYYISILKINEILDKPIKLEAIYRKNSNKILKFKDDYKYIKINECIKELDSKILEYSKYIKTDLYSLDSIVRIKSKIEYRYKEYDKKLKEALNNNN